VQLVARRAWDATPRSSLQGEKWTATPPCAARFSTDRRTPGQPQDAGTVNINVAPRFQQTPELAVARWPIPSWWLRTLQLLQGARVISASVVCSLVE
jgi:hypothetical protein